MVGALCALLAVTVSASQPFGADPLMGLSPDVAAPAATATDTAPPAPAWNPDYRPLERQLAAQLRTLPGEWSLYFKDLDSGKTFISTARDMVTQTIWNDGINHLLKGKVAIGHKEGAISGVANDVGIVYSKHIYILAVMTKDQGNLDQSFETIATISRTIWNYQAKLK